MWIHRNSPDEKENEFFSYQQKIISLLSNQSLLLLLRDGDLFKILLYSVRNYFHLEVKLM